MSTNVNFKNLKYNKNDDFVCFFNVTFLCIYITNLSENKCELLKVIYFQKNTIMTK